MKTRFDPRHQKRETTVQNLYAWEFQKKQTLDELAVKVKTHLNKIDPLISASASQWPLEQINKVDLAILRLAIFELAIAKKEPVKVIIDEAVELAKEFGSESSSSFINGVLGKILKFKGGE